KKEITDIAAAAESLQPKGYTLATAQVKTPVPFLLRGSLREYQHIGLDWLVTMNEKMLNGILADEMGLGKTIQTIALLGHLACDRGNWGPHLVVVPTSVMLNWEMEFKRWFPAFKILTYYGVPKERKQKRQGWTRPNAFHVCITSYKLVLQDHQAFRRKKWKYLILDEAQNIKNFKSQRYTVRHQHRLLLTGTPLQNSLMELWSLMHFLMPHVFQSHREFREWFSNPLTGMIEGSQEYNESLVKRLHKVLRPFLLRRIKMDVEKQMPKKYEHIVRCRLSKRQRYLYDDFMSQATTRETLASGHFMSVINILMQLRKVCNHPNLFDPRPITSPFITQGICYTTASLVLTALEYDPWRHVDLSIFDLVNAENQLSRYEAEVFLPNRKVTRKLIEEISTAPDPPPRPKPVRMKKPLPSTATDGIVPTASPAAVAQRLIAGVSTEQLPSLGLPQRLLQGVVPEVAGAAHVYSVAVGQKSVGAVERMASPAVVVQRQALGAIIDTTRPVAPLAQPPVPVAPRLISELTQHAASPTLQRLAPGIAIDGTQAMLQAQRVTQGLTAEGSQLTAAASPTLLRLSQFTRNCLGARPAHVRRSSHTAASGKQHLVMLKNSKNAGHESTVVVLPGNTKIGMATLPQQQLAGAAISMPARSIAGRQARPKRSSAVPAAVPLTRGPTTRSVDRKATAEEAPSKRKDSASAAEAPAPKKPAKRSPLYLVRGRSHINTVGASVHRRINWEQGPEADWFSSEKKLKSNEEVPPRLLRHARFSRGACCVSGCWDNVVCVSALTLACRFIFVVPPVESPPISLHAPHPPPSMLQKEKALWQRLHEEMSPRSAGLHRILCNMRTQFPDLRLIQYDCGKLQTLDILLRKFKAGSHRVLIFTQMTRMLDVLEQFLNFHGYIYLRLDGTTRVEQRQFLMDRFNADARIFCFILSTRSGGVGVNLTGADTVVFYDSDWNPTMDAQAQDRCHRIGQTRDVHIYRLISERTVEENILKKANQKRMLGDVAIEGGNFTTAYFKQQTIRELFEMPVGMEDASTKGGVRSACSLRAQALGKAEDEEDIRAASQARAEQVAELAEFNENAADDGEDVCTRGKAFSAIFLCAQLTPIERYALKYLEASIAAETEE
uniref:Snf2-related CREBBP activator protein n=1 Tax=Petromyzon marinus TaxID=7757 RepID=S4R6R6_PETMA